MPDLVYDHGMTDDLTEIETAQDDRDAADGELAAAVNAAIDRVEADVEHLHAELGSGAGLNDPTRLARVADRIKSGTANIRALVGQLGTVDVAPPAAGEQPAVAAPSDAAPSPDA